MIVPGVTDIGPGDVVFFKKAIEKGNNDFEKAITAVATEAVMHVAMQCDGEWLVHAVPDSGVCRELLVDIVHRLQPDSFEVHRAQVPQAIRITACQWAGNKIGTKYNDIFSANMLDSEGNEAFYCCQLVTKSYESAGIPDFCPLHQLNFEGPDGKILPYWKNYYRERSLPVPQGAPGSHPAKLIQSKYLKPHFHRIFRPMGKFVVPKVIDSALHFIRGARVVPKFTEQFDVIQPRNGSYICLKFIFLYKDVTFLKR